MKRRLCLQPGCLLNPSFGNPGGKREYCKAHKKPFHDQLAAPHCLAAGCSVLASYGYVATRKREYCTAHKKSMQEYLNQVICAADGCTTRASKKFPHCNKHASTEMEC